MLGRHAYRRYAECHAAECRCAKLRNDKKSFDCQQKKADIARHTMAPRHFDNLPFRQPDIK